MTAGGMIQALGMREVRANIRAVVARVEAGEALVVLRDGQPTAVMLAFDEAQRWQQIERGLAALHGLELYPELARDTAELARLVRHETRPKAADVRRLAELPRDVLAPLRTMGITDARTGFAGMLDEITAGRTMTIVSGGRFAVTLVCAPRVRPPARARPHGRLRSAPPAWTSPQPTTRRSAPSSATSPRDPRHPTSRPPGRAGHATGDPHHAASAAHSTDRSRSSAPWGCSGSSGPRRASPPRCPQAPGRRSRR